MLKDDGVSLPAIHDDCLDGKMEKAENNFSRLNTRLTLDLSFDEDNPVCKHNSFNDLSSIIRKRHGVIRNFKDVYL